MSTENNLFWNSGAAKERLEGLQKAQSEFVTRLLNEGSEFQRRQFTLLTDLIQNQVAFSSQIFSNALNVINDNKDLSEKKPVKSK